VGGVQATSIMFGDQASLGYNVGEPDRVGF
jgi:hypothetical protein